MSEGGRDEQHCLMLSDVEKVNPCRPQWRNAVCCCSRCDNINVDTVKAYVLMSVRVCLCVVEESVRSRYVRV